MWSNVTYIITDGAILGVLWASEIKEKYHSAMKVMCGSGLSLIKLMRGSSLMRA